MTRLTTWTRRRGRLPGLGISQVPLASTNRQGKYFLETMGCQMNVADSERMEGKLLDLGLERTENKVSCRPGHRTCC